MNRKSENIVVNVAVINDKPIPKGTAIRKATGKRSQVHEGNACGGTIIINKSVAQAVGKKSMMVRRVNEKTRAARGKEKARIKFFPEEMRLAAPPSCLFRKPKNVTPMTK